MRYSNSISYEALKHVGAHAEKETKYKDIFEYLLLSFQTTAMFRMTTLQHLFHRKADNIREKSLKYTTSRNVSEICSENVHV